MLLLELSHNPDLAKLLDEGFILEVCGPHLLVHEIPYVNSQKEIKMGTIVTVLSFINPTLIGKPIDHTVHFSGETPCDENGVQLSSIINTNGIPIITPNFEAHYFFSYKPNCGFYENYYEKITAYALYLSSFAKILNPFVSEKSKKTKMLLSGSDVFKYPDTNSARAKIDYENCKFHNLKIGIIGVGGTGSYILDLVSKTQVKEIHIFDDDNLQLHNTFRTPGTLPDELIMEMIDLKKVNYLYSVYSRMHLGIKAHPYKIVLENIVELKELDYVFICIDNNEVRFMIVNELEIMDVAFTDVGLGVVKNENGLLGTIRVTSACKENYDHLKDVIGNKELEEDEYNTNIQIADLNCLNAALAVVKWKRYVGFYVDLKMENHTLYHIETNRIINDNPKT